jgi:hypothetical protein
MDAALFEQIVLELLEDERVEIGVRLFPVRCLAGFETDKLDGKPRCRVACERFGGRSRVVARLVERALELVITSTVIVQELAHDAAGEPFLESIAERDYTEAESLPDHGAPSSSVVSW